jgi:hypothetical protein
MIFSRQQANAIKAFDDQLAKLGIERDYRRTDKPRCENVIKDAS